MFITETDLLMPGMASLPARQEDGPRIRSWEVAGTPHADTYTLLGGVLDSGSVSPETLARAFTPKAEMFAISLSKPINAAPQHHYVAQAALSALNSWVAAGNAPPSSPRLEIAEATAPTFVKDAVGNTKGGIRSPWVDVPIATYSAFGPPGPGFASIFGTTELFDPSRFAAHYPGGSAPYLQKFEVALESAIQAGFILGADRREKLDIAAILYPK